MFINFVDLVFSFFEACFSYANLFIPYLLFLLAIVCILLGCLSICFGLISIFDKKSWRKSLRANQIFLVFAVVAIFSSLTISEFLFTYYKIVLLIYIVVAIIGVTRPISWPDANKKESEKT